VLGWPLIVFRSGGEAAGADEYLANRCCIGEAPCGKRRRGNFLEDAFADATVD